MQRTSHRPLLTFAAAALSVVLAALGATRTAYAAGTPVITGSLPRGTFSQFSFTIAVPGVQNTGSPTDVSIATLTTSDVADLTKVLQVFISQINSGSALPWGVGSSPPTSTPDEVFISLDSTPNITSDPSPLTTSTLTYQVTVYEAQSGILATKFASGQGTVGIKFAAGTSTADTSTNQTPNLTQASFVITDAPDLFEVDATNKSLIIKWNDGNATVNSYASATNAATPNAPTGVDVYVIDTTVFKTANFDCKKYTPAAAPVAGSTTPTPAAADPAVPNGCAFTAPASTADTNPCVAFTDKVNCPSPGNCPDPRSLDYLTPSTIGSVAGVTLLQNQTYTNGPSGINVNGLTNGTPYIVFLQFEPTGTAVSRCLTASPSPNFTLTELNGEGDAKVVDVRCFVATAAFGTPLAPELHYFRKFREKALLSNWLGRRFVHYYYELSPPLANFIMRHPRLKAAARDVLEVPATFLRAADAYY